MAVHAMSSLFVDNRHRLSISVILSIFLARAWRVFMADGLVNLNFLAQTHQPYYPFYSSKISNLWYDQFL